MNGLQDYTGSLVYIRLLLVRSIQWLEWNKINPEIERTCNLLSRGGGDVWCTHQRCIANTHPAPERGLGISRVRFIPTSLYGTKLDPPRSKDCAGKWRRKEHRVTFSMKLSHEISSETPPRVDPSFLPNLTPLLSELSRVILFLTQRVLQLWEIIAVTHILRAKSTVKQFNRLQL